MKGLLIAAVVSLAVGVGLIFGYCHGTTGFSFGYPLSGTSLHVDITTTGVPALAGLALTIVGVFLLAVDTIIAAIGLFRRTDTPVTRRAEPFEE